jgi:hypothetical protein
MVFSTIQTGEVLQDKLLHLELFISQRLFFLLKRLTRSFNEPSWTFESRLQCSAELAFQTTLLLAELWYPIQTLDFEVRDMRGVMLPIKLVFSTLTSKCREFLGLKGDHLIIDLDLTRIILLMLHEDGAFFLLPLRWV